MFTGKRITDLAAMPKRSHHAIIVEDIVYTTAGYENDTTRETVLRYYVYDDAASWRADLATAAKAQLALGTPARKFRGIIVEVADIDIKVTVDVAVNKRSAT